LEAQKPNEELRTAHVHLVSQLKTFFVGHVAMPDAAPPSVRASVSVGDDTNPLSLGIQLNHPYSQIPYPWSILNCNKDPHLHRPL